MTGLAAVATAASTRLNTLLPTTISAHLLPPLRICIPLVNDYEPILHPE